MSEVWRPVIGHEKHYEVSNHGSVRRSAAGRGTSPGLVLRIRYGDNHYPRLVLYSGGRGKMIYVHRAVIAAHVGPPPHKGCPVKFRDGDERNLHVSNLQYGRDPKHGVARSKLTEADICEIRRSVNQAGETRTSVADRYGMTPMAIYYIATGVNWSHVMTPYDIPGGGFRRNKNGLGEQHGRSKLTADAVREIRRSISAREESATQLGRRFGVSPTTISAVACGRIWSHVK